MVSAADRYSGGGLALATMVVAVLLSGCLGDDPYGEPVATDTVRIPGEWIFVPSAIEVTSNTTVTWMNDGGQAHTVTIDGSDIDATLGPGDTFTHTFDGPGTYDYVCRFHPPDMVGRVVVTEADAGPGTNGPAQ